MRKLPITLVMCVYNEEEIIENALRSAADYVSEIVVVHDGPCSDSTGSIVRKYGGKFIETEKNKGASEFIRIKTYELASQKYILQLDADEALDASLQGILADAIASDADFITVNWLHYRYGKVIKTLVQRAFLFKKDKIYFIECPHEAVRPKKGATTKHYDVDLFNDAEDRYKNQKEIDKNQLSKQAKWAPVHARALVIFRELKRFNADKNSKGSLFNELLSSRAYLLHGYLTIPFIFIVSSLVASLKFRINPFLLFSELPIPIKYYYAITRNIKKIKSNESRND